MSTDLTLVVVIHDSAGDLERLLDSIDRHLSPPPPVVVVDSGSHDGGGSLAARWGAEVVTLDGNPGFGPANNAGVARVRTAACALVNPDVELLGPGLADLGRLAAGRDALFAPRLLNADGTLQRSAHPHPGRLATLVPALLPARALPRPARAAAEPYRAGAPRDVGWAIAACIVARTATLRRLGPFDPDTFLFFEDLDLCLRAQDAGVPTLLRPDVALLHHGARSTGPHYGGEPHELLARRRRAVIEARLGARALAVDDAGQALTFVTRALARAALGRRPARERAQLAALRAARRAG